MHRSFHCIAAALALAASACGKQTFLAAALLGTPAVPNPVPGLPPIPAQTYAIAYLGTIDTSNPTKISSASIATIKGATSSLAFHSVLQNADDDLSLHDNGDGSYSLDSDSQPKLTYEATQQYTLVLQGGDSKEAFGAKLLPAPPAQIVEFHPNQVQSWSSGKDFTLTRSDAASDGGRYLPAFVAVMQIDPQNPAAISLSNAVYTTVPKDGSSLLKFALSDDSYRKQTFTVPGATFAKGQYYVVALLVMRYGLVSDNTFLGSTAMCGTGDAGLLVVN